MRAAALTEGVALLKGVALAHLVSGTALAEPPTSIHMTAT